MVIGAALSHVEWNKDDLGSPVLEVRPFGDRTGEITAM
jgi:hypothetical protein